MVVEGPPPDGAQIVVVVDLATVVAVVVDDDVDGVTVVVGAASVVEDTEASEVMVVLDGAPVVGPRLASAGGATARACTPVPPPGKALGKAAGATTDTVEVTETDGAPGARRGGLTADGGADEGTRPERPRLATAPNKPMLTAATPAMVALTTRTLSSPGVCLRSKLCPDDVYLRPRRARVWRADDRP
jgi:hypothetical protein